MDKEKVIDAVKKAAPEGRLACAEALALAEELKVPRRVIGEAANAAKVKIAHCQLGCFK